MKSKRKHTHKRPEEPDRKQDILLAEDDLEMRKLLTWSLERRGYEVTECSDGTTLMKKLGLLGPGNGLQSYNLIISDIRMPGATGLQVLESVREFSDFPPMILITAFPDAESHELAMRLGAAAMMAKPFDIEELIEKVGETIPSRDDERRQHGAWPETEGPQSFPFDITFRHESGSQAARDYIQNLAAKFQSFADHITNGRIIIDQMDHDRLKKHRYTVTLVLSTSGKSIVVKHNSDSGNESENLYMAINVAFGTAVRKLKHYLDKKQGHRKHGAKPARYAEMDEPDYDEPPDLDNM